MCLNPEDAQTARLFTADGPFQTLSAGSGGGMQRHGICTERTGTMEENERDGAGAAMQTDVAGMEYVVRRLTPVECERLTGLPDGWTVPAFTPEEIDDELVAEFMRVHDEYGAIMAKYAGKAPPKPKTASQVRAWLERISDPAACPDAPRYKACGNGWATNQPRWIMLRLLHADGIDPWEDGERNAVAPPQGSRPCQSPTAD